MNQAPYAYETHMNASEGTTRETIVRRSSPVAKDRGLGLGSGTDQTLALPDGISKPTTRPHLLDVRH